MLYVRGKKNFELKKERRNWNLYTADDGRRDFLGKFSNQMEAEEFIKKLLNNK